MSSIWTDNELRRIGAATELQIASRRRDGSLRFLHHDLDRPGR
jgi:hypothetical protein